MRWFSDVSMHQSPRESLLNAVGRQHPRVSNCVGLGCGPRICISEELSAAAAGPGPHRENY